MRVIQSKFIKTTPKIVQSWGAPGAPVLDPPLVPNINENVVLIQVS